MSKFQMLEPIIENSIDELVFVLPSNISKKDVHYMNFIVKDDPNIILGSTSFNNEFEQYEYCLDDIIKDVILSINLIKNAYIVKIDSAYTNRDIIMTFIVN